MADDDSWGAYSAQNQARIESERQAGFAEMENRQDMQRKSARERLWQQQQMFPASSTQDHRVANRSVGRSGRPAVPFSWTVGIALAIALPILATQNFSPDETDLWAFASFGLFVGGYWRPILKLILIAVIFYVGYKLTMNA